MKAKQENFITALMTESTTKAAYEKAGISKFTAYKYLRDPEFRAELDKRRIECIDNTVRYLQGKLDLCNKSLVGIIEDDSIAPQIRINAINTLYATCKGFTDTADIIARLNDLEQAEAEREAAHDN